MYLLVFFVLMKFNLNEKLLQIRLKPILIPPEHGIWGFTIEALILGLYLTEGISKYFITIMMFFLPFAKQTLKIFLQDLFSGRTFLRKYIALLFLIIFIMIFIFLFYFTYKFALYSFWYFILLGFLLGLIVVLLEIKGFYQHVLTEILGSFIPIFFILGMNTTTEIQYDHLMFIVIVLGFRNVSSILLTIKLVDFIKFGNINNYFFIIFLLIISTLILYFYYFINLPMFYILIIYLLIFIGLYYLIQFKIIKKAHQLGWIQIIIGLCYILAMIIIHKN